MTNSELEQELQELRDLFDLQQTRMEDAVALWQAATGNTCLPDLGVLLKWLMDRAEVSEARVLEIVDACFHWYASSYREAGKKHALKLLAKGGAK